MTLNLNIQDSFSVEELSRSLEKERFILRINIQKMSSRQAFKTIMYALHRGASSVEKQILQKACKTLNHPLFSYEQVSATPAQDCSLADCQYCSVFGVGEKTLVK